MPLSSTNSVTVAPAGSTARTDRARTSSRVTTLTPRVDGDDPPSGTRCFLPRKPGHRGRAGSGSRPQLRTPNGQGTHLNVTIRPLPASPVHLKMSARPDDASRDAAGGPWQRLRQGLRKTRDILTADLGDLIRSRRQIDASVLEEIEARLLQSDAGVDTTAAIIDALSAALKRNELDSLEAVLGALNRHL